MCVRASCDSFLIDYDEVCLCMRDLLVSGFAVFTLFFISVFRFLPSFRLESDLRFVVLAEVLCGFGSRHFFIGFSVSLILHRCFSTIY